MSQVTPSRVSEGVVTGHTPTTFAYYAAFIVLGLGLAALGPTLPGLAKQTQSSLREISFLFTARSLGYMCGALLGGRLYDRVSGHPVMAGMLGGVAVLLVLVPQVPVLWMLLAVMLVLGLSEATLDVGGNTLLTWVHRDNLGPYMNALHFFFGVGAFFSPILVAWVLLVTGEIAWTYRLLALLVLPVALVLWRLPSPEIQSADVKKNGRADSTLIVLIALSFFLCVGAEVGFAGWIYTYAMTLGLADEAMAAYLTSAFWGAFTLGRLLGIPIASRYSPRKILWGDLIGCVLSVGLILVWPGSTAVVWIGTFGFGLSLASMFATLLALAGEYMTITGRITGWFFVGTSTGAMTVPWLIGQFFESVGPRVTMVFVLGDLILALGVLGGMVLYLRKIPVRRAF
ncbi:MAG: MFS transporter [bacterium]|nr:MFS transporter [bacterium]